MVPVPSAFSLTPRSPIRRKWKGWRSDSKRELPEWPITWPAQPVKSRAPSPMGTAEETCGATFEQVRIRPALLAHPQIPQCFGRSRLPRATPLFEIPPFFTFDGVGPLGTSLVPDAPALRRRRMAPLPPVGNLPPPYESPFDTSSLDASSIDAPPSYASIELLPPPYCSLTFPDPRRPPAIGASFPDAPATQVRKWLSY
jgi:hypothetical protein